MDKKRPAKRQTAALDKRKKAQVKDKGIQNEELRALSEKVNEALGLLADGEADAIIGERTPEYNTLIQGMDAIQKMGWASAKSFGMRQTEACLRYGAQTQIVSLDLIHKAYALGIRHGREAK